MNLGQEISEANVGNPMDRREPNESTKRLRGAGRKGGRKPIIQKKDLFPDSPRDPNPGGHARFPPPG